MINKIKLPVSVGYGAVTSHILDSDGEYVDLHRVCDALNSIAMKIREKNSKNDVDFTDVIQ